MKRSNVYTLAGCLLAIGIGGVAGILQPDSPSEASRSLMGTTRAGGQDGAPVSAAAQQTIVVDEALARSLQTETGAKRWLTMFSALETAGSFEMPGLIRAAGNDHAMVRMLASRWAELDPVDMFQSLHSDYLLPEGSPAAFPARWILADVLLEEWTGREPRAVVETLSNVREFPGRYNLRMRVIDHLVKVDTEMGLQAMLDWNIRHFIPDMKAVAEWASREPHRVAEFAKRFGSDYTGLEILKTVGKSWAQIDPEAGLRFAASLKPDQRATFAAGVIRTWAERNLNGAIAAATAERDPQFRAALAQGLVDIWGKADPSAALTWSQKHLRGAARTEAIAGLVKAAAEKDLQTASELVADMEPGAAQNGACASIFETWFNKGEAERSAAFEWLASLPDATVRQAALEKVQWNWAWREPDAVRKFIEGPYGELASGSMIHQVARHQTAKNPDAAMQWAKQLPKERGKQAKEAVLNHWLEVRPEGAMEYARKLPSGEERTQAIRSISQTLIFHPPAQAADWYRKLTASEQKLMREMIGQSGLSESQRKGLNELIQNP